MADVDVIRPVRALPAEIAGARVERDRPHGTEEGSARHLAAVQDQVAAPFIALSTRPATDQPRDRRDGGDGGRNLRPGPSSAFLAQQIAQDHGAAPPPAEVVAGAGRLPACA